MDKIVYVHGSYFGNNFGDVLLVSLFAERITAMGYTVTLPYADTSYRDLTGFNTGKQVAQQAVAGVFCGGGYFGEPSNRRLVWSFRNYTRHVRPYLFFVRKGLPYGVFGVGYGPITYEPFHSLSKKIFNNAKCIFVRDMESADIAQRYGVSREIGVLSDAVISLKESDIPTQFRERSDEFYREAKGSYTIGVHLTNKYKNEEDFANVVSGIKKSVIKEKDCKVVFIIDGKSRTNRKLKQEIDAEILKSELSIKGSIIWSYENHWDLVSLISGLDMVVTSKLHVGIVGASLGVNVISIPYHSKTKRFYAQIGYPDRCLSGGISGQAVTNLINGYFGASGIRIPDDIESQSNQIFVEIEKFLKSCS